jgi:hypothetical protein
LIEVQKNQLVPDSQTPKYKISPNLLAQIILVHLGFDFFICACDIGSDTSFKTAETWQNSLIVHYEIGIGLELDIILIDRLAFADMISNIAEFSLKIYEVINDKANSSKREAYVIANFPYDQSLQIYQMQVGYSLLLDYFFLFQILNCWLTWYSHTH